jgi:mannose-6-phosphate isomerase-like protein (cupin superfamily)
MAIASVGKSGGAKGAIGYVLKTDKEKEPIIIGGTFGTKEEITRQFDAYSALRPGVKNQVSHISISLKPGEHLDEEQKLNFAERLLEKLNFQKERVPYLVVEHHDKEYEHFHIVAGRIRDDGTVVSDSKLALRTIQATKEIEKEFGLEQVEFRQNSDRRIKRGEYKLMERTGELSTIAEAKLVIDEILKGKPQTKEFVENLQNSGFQVRPNISEKTGKMNGFSFKKEEITFKSSAIAKDYSFQNLQKNGLDYDQGRDAAFLIEVKHEFTQKPNHESRGNRGIETAKSIADQAESATHGTQPSVIEIQPNLSKTESGISQIQGRDRQSQIDDSKDIAVQTDVSSNLSAAARQTHKTQIPDRGFPESGRAGDQEKSGTYGREDSGTRESTEEFISINFTVTEPKLKDAPAHKHEREIERSRNFGMER